MRAVERGGPPGLLQASDGLQDFPSDLFDFDSQKSHGIGMKIKVSERGQITIPKAVRQRLGIKPGQVLEVRERDGAVVAYKVATIDPLLAVTGIIASHGGTDELIEEIRGEARPVRSD